VAVADTLVRVSHLAMHLEGHLAELDINPLMALPSGQGVKAIDVPSCFAAHSDQNLIHFRSCGYGWSPIHNRRLSPLGGSCLHILCALARSA
jgi:hypothetical protein